MELLMKWMKLYSSMFEKY